MASSGKSFDQIRAILGKLDRQVDEARHKRLGDDEEPIRPARREDEPSGEPGAGGTEGNGAPDPNGPNAGMPPRQSKYGRARPLRRAGDSTGAWASPKPGAGRGLDETVG